MRVVQHEHIKHHIAFIIMIQVAVIIVRVEHIVMHEQAAVLVVENEHIVMHEQVAVLVVRREKNHHQINVDVNGVLNLKNENLIQCGHQSLRVLHENESNMIANVMTMHLVNLEKGDGNIVIIRMRAVILDDYVLCVCVQNL